jgi:hypothetical protein
MRRLRGGVALVFALLIVLGGTPVAVGARQSEHAKQASRADQLLGEQELSAMLLTPLDLADEGLEGYALRGGSTDTLDEEFLGFLSTEDRPPDEVQEILEDAGFVQSRWVYMDLPSEEDPGLAARRVSVWVDEYTESGRALSDVIDVYLDFGGETIDGTQTIGEDSAIVTYTDRASDTDVEMLAMVLAFRYENQIGQIEIADFQTQSPDIEPSVDEIEALAERLLERIETVRDDGGPGLEHQVLRFESDGELVYYTGDNYTRIDGDLLPRYGQDDDALDLQEEMDEQFGITDVYRMSQTIGWNGEVATVWSVTVRQFDDEDDAADWVASADEWMETFGAADVEMDDDDLGIGDSAVAVTYLTGDDGDTDPYWTAAFIQVGDIGLVVQIAYPGESPDIDLVAELAEMQVACVEDGGCPIESELPDALIDLVDSL